MGRLTKAIDAHLFPSLLLARPRGYEPYLPVHDPYAPSIDDAGHVATWNCNRLIHSDVEVLKPLPCLIATELIGHSTVVKVTIHAEEQRHPISHELKVSFIESAENVG